MKKSVYFIVFLIAMVSLSCGVFAEDFDVKKTYRLTNTFLGKKRSLDTYSDNKNEPFMGETGNYSGQFWTLTPLKGGYYRLTNSFLGSQRSLEATSNGLSMGKSSSSPTQAWKLTSQDGYFRLTNQSANGQSLDTYSDGQNEPFMGESGNYSGQFWVVAPVGADEQATKKASLRGSRARRKK